jgi:hypothetical protein
MGDAGVTFQAKNGIELLISIKSGILLPRKETVLRQIPDQRPAVGGNGLLSIIFNRIVLSSTSTGGRKAG